MGKEKRPLRAYPGDDLRRNTCWVSHPAVVFEDEQSHGHVHRRTDADEDVGAEAGRLPPDLALETDHPAAERRRPAADEERHHYFLKLQPLFDRRYPGRHDYQPAALPLFC